MVQAAALRVQHSKRTFAQGKGCLDRCPDPFVIAVFGLELVHDKLDEMGLVAVEGIGFLKRDCLPVYTDFRIAFFAHLLEELLVAALASAHQRGEQQAFLAMVFFHDQVHDGCIGVSYHRLAGHRRICGRSSGEEKAEKIGDFGYGAHCGAGIVAGGLLLDRYDRAQARDALHRRFFKNSHKVLGVGGKGVHIAALTLGVDGVEGERRLAAAAQSRDYDKFAARYVYIDVLQVVCPGSAHFNESVLIHKRRQSYEFIVSLTPVFRLVHPYVGLVIRLFRLPARHL